MKYKMIIKFSTPAKEWEIVYDLKQSAENILEVIFYVMEEIISFILFYPLLYKHY